MIPHLPGLGAHFWPMDQGCPANWLVGTPSSMSFEKALEKLPDQPSASNACRSQQQHHYLDLLVEEGLLVLGVLLGVLAEALVLDERHVGTTQSARDR